MNISQYEVYCTVAQVKSFSKAAKLLHLTQPAVSAQIQSLENYYDVKLFERNAQGVTMTEAGQIVFEYAQKFLQLHEEMEKTLSHALNLANQELVVGACSSVGNYALPCSIWTFKEKYPEVNIRLEIGNSEEIIRRVLDKSVDVGIVEGPVSNKNLTVHLIESSDLVLVVPFAEPWLDKNSITLAEMKQVPFILREEGSGVRKGLEDFLAQHGVKLSELRVVTEMGSLDAIKSAIEAGLGVSVFPRLAVQKELRRGVFKALPVEDLAMSLECNVTYLTKEYQTPIAKRFVRFIAAPTERAFC